MAKSIGGALQEGQPVVFTLTGRVPQVICEPGKEREALELMEKMKLIELLRPVDGRKPDGTLQPFDEKFECPCGGTGRRNGLKNRCPM